MNVALEMVDYCPLVFDGIAWAQLSNYGIILYMIHGSRARNVTLPRMATPISARTESALHTKCIHLHNV